MTKGKQNAPPATYAIRAETGPGGPIERLFSHTEKMGMSLG